MEKQSKRRQLGAFAVISTFLLIILICSVVIVDKLVYPQLTENSYGRKTISFDGVSYFPRQDVRVYLLLGIDREGFVTDSTSYRNSGAADVVLLAIFDETAREYRVIALNRDSMVQVPVLGIGGKHAGDITAQLALSHTYGNGLQQSCENTRDTVSNLLYGTTIHQYISMNMDVISILTDAVGGVRVNITDDFSSIDSTIQKGEMVLNGDQAYKFIRSRQNLGDQLNVSRMERHKEFVNGFIDAFRENVGQNPTKAMSVYEQISPYVVTDCSEQMMTDLLDRFCEYDYVGIITPTGTSVRGEEYMEFYLDEDMLRQTVLSLLFEPKN